MKDRRRRPVIFKKETAMKRNSGFDEVMIVNPYEPGSNANQGVRFMRFYAAPPGMGYYAEAPDHYGYYAEAPDHYGYYANLPEQYGAIDPGYNQVEPVGYVAEPYQMGYYGDPYAMGGYGENEPIGYYGH